MTDTNTLIFVVIFLQMLIIMLIKKYIMQRKVKVSLSDMYTIGMMDAYFNLRPQYDGSDWSDDWCQQYMIGYQNQKERQVVSKTQNLVSSN